jgi:hypothetical protein
LFGIISLFIILNIFLNLFGVAFFEYANIDLNIGSLLNPSSMASFEKPVNLLCANFFASSNGMPKRLNTQGYSPRLKWITKKKNSKFNFEKALDIKKVDSVALAKIAALASRETGDSRRAIELLIKAVRVAESEGNGRLSEKEVDIAEDSLEVDKSQELIRCLATQQRIALQSCYSIIKSGTRKAVTGQVYEVYQTVCQSQGYRPLSQRRFSDMISYLDLYGLINAPVISRGRYGKTREIMKSLPNQVIEGFL